MIFLPLTSGSSVEGHEIEAYKSDIQADKYLYLIGGTHGDEVEGVYVLQQLFNWLKENHELKDMPIVVVPILNPDGYRAGTRINSHAVDLNRNYPTKDWSPKFSKDKYNPGPEALSEPENKFLDKLFHKYTPSFIMSFHTWKPIINYNGNAQDVAQFLADYNKYPIADDIGYPTPGSLGSYVPEKFDGAPVITFECPELNDEISLKSIWEENEKGLKDLMTSQLLVKKMQLN